MDEPLSNLDAKLRVQTRAELVELQRRLAATIVYVTHDQVEAMTMGHRIAILDTGVLQQVGAPQEVYARPANLFVARFIGSPPMNTVTGRVSRVNETLVAEIPGGQIPLEAGLAAAVTARGLDEVVIGVRPEALRFDASGGIPAQVSVVESLGHERHVVCRLADQQLVIVRQDAHEAAPAAESSTFLVAEPGALHVFDPGSGARINA
jgi:multiple sugar transport system ATP-binding protein